MTDKEKICELEKRIKLLEIEGQSLKESMSAATQRISDMTQAINGLMYLVQVQHGINRYVLEKKEIEVQ